MRWRVALAGSLLGALVVWLAIAAVSPGYVADIESRKARTKWIVEQGIEDAYRMRIDYPPGNLYLFALVGRVYQATADPRFDHRQASASQYLTFLFKIPPTLFHLATGLLVFLIVRRVRTERVAWLAATLLLFDPAAIFDVAHQGQYDPVHSLFSLAAVAAAGAGSSGLAGAAIALAALTKPQSWVLLPLVATLAWRKGGPAGLLHWSIGGLAAATIVLLPFVLTNRLSHMTRLWDYMNTNSPANQVISANAHNLWWLPTIFSGRWLLDSESLIGPISYRLLAVCLVLLMVLMVIRRAMLGSRAGGPMVLAAAVAAGWFFVTPRAHEYHAFFVLPFLAAAWPARPALLGCYLLASVSLLLNLALHDPLIVGALAAPPDPGAPLPGWYVGLTLLNVALFAVLALTLLGSVILRGSGPRPSTRPVAV